MSCGDCNSPALSSCLQKEFKVPGFQKAYANSITSKPHLPEESLGESEESVRTERSGLLVPIACKGSFSTRSECLGVAKVINFYPCAKVEANVKRVVEQGC